jgi:hypothetical protein
MPPQQQHHAVATASQNWQAGAVHLPPPRQQQRGRLRGREGGQQQQQQQLARAVLRAIGEKDLDAAMAAVRKLEAAALKLRGKQQQHQQQAAAAPLTPGQLKAVVELCNAVRNQQGQGNAARATAALVEVRACVRACVRARARRMWLWYARACCLAVNPNTLKPPQITHRPLLTPPQTKNNNHKRNTTPPTTQHTQHPKKTQDPRTPVDGAGQPRPRARVPHTEPGDDPVPLPLRPPLAGGAGPPGVPGPRGPAPQAVRKVRGRGWAWVWVEGASEFGLFVRLFFSFFFGSRLLSLLWFAAAAAASRMDALQSARANPTVQNPTETHQTTAPSTRPPTRGGHRPCYGFCRWLAPCHPIPPWCLGQRGRSTPRGGICLRRTW